MGTFSKSSRGLSHPIPTQSQKYVCWVHSTGFILCLSKLYLHLSGLNSREELWRQTNERDGKVNFHLKPRTTATPPYLGQSSRSINPVLSPLNTPAPLHFHPLLRPPSARFDLFATPSMWQPPSLSTIGFAATLGLHFHVMGRWVCAVWAVGCVVRVCVCTCQQFGKMSTMAYTQCAGAACMYLSLNY